ncbi:cilium assembly protein DZIP1L [Anopheles nili]|uniref:cilium assembly protein DZIP1L n=1 Tax=Anopheles nili TaxID=185578 RepID=UPI00237A9995|nr:cilium assembly protein DZIP1L [Anopheles nili]
MSYKWHHNFPKIAREAGFKLRETTVGHCIDWRFIASAEPHCILSEHEYEKLDECIPHLTEVPIANLLNTRILDPAIGKYFTLAQFSIQYLSFCKQFLDDAVYEIKNSIHDLRNENEKLDKIIKKRTEEVALLHKKLQRAENMNYNHFQQSNVVYACTKCTKNFISSELLNAHMARKHVSNIRTLETVFERKSSATDTNLINTIKLELEVKQLKERLNVAEKDLLNHRSQNHSCLICSNKSNNATEGRKEKIFRSVSIQTNLTDDKDCNETEVKQFISNPLCIETLTPSVTRHLEEQAVQASEVISKSDLQSIIDEQKRLFDSWKIGETQMFNQEIETVKQHLVDAIHTIEKSERNTPIPVLNGDVWKDRYQDLEKMYEISQKQASETIASFEKAYATKLDQLQKMLLQARELEHKENPKTCQFIELTQHTFA